MITPDEQKWLDSLEKFLPHTGFSQCKCDKCGDILTLGERTPKGTLRKWLQRHFTGDCVKRPIS